MKRGDIILYRATNTLLDRVIARVTGGPYVHVSIAYSGGFCIAATNQGIRCDALPSEDANHVVIDLNPVFGIEHGLAWAWQQIGKQYGWTDIVYQAVKFLAPNNPLQFGAKDQWDCSDFVTRYLDHIGYELPDMYSDPYANTPNDIARLFKLLPPRKAVSS
jgi:hypothetical protein